MFKQFFLKETNMMWAIALNSIVIFLLYFPQLHENYPDFFHLLEIIDCLFILFFVVEAVVKIKSLSAKGYFSNGWNKFDFFIVVVSLPSLLHFFPAFTMINTSFLKILRLGRMIRLVRFMSFIPRMESIIRGLSRALKASVFVMLALIFLNFILALFTCHLYGEIAPEYFRDPAISSYYIFQLFTIEGWNEIPLEVIKASEAGEGHHPLFAGLTRFYFILVVLSGGIFGMSLANAVFVDEMTSDNNEDLENKIDNLELQLKEIKEMLKS
ncbi:MAG: voltage-gated sodium channel [Ulvibacter sp.]|jgi:voltage-gated sodium channel